MTDFVFFAQVEIQTSSAPLTDDRTTTDDDDARARASATATGSRWGLKD